MNSLQNFIVEEEGFVGAEKALVALVALGLILFVIKIIQKGAQTGSQTASDALSNQKTGAAATF